MNHPRSESIDLPLPVVSFSQILMPYTGMHTIFSIKIPRISLLVLHTERKFLFALKKPIGFSASRREIVADSEQPYLQFRKINECSHSAIRIPAQPFAKLIVTRVNGRARASRGSEMWRHKPDQRYYASVIYVRARLAPPRILYVYILYFTLTFVFDPINSLQVKIIFSEESKRRITDIGNDSFLFSRNWRNLLTIQRYDTVKNEGRNVTGLTRNANAITTERKSSAKVLSFL